MVTIDHSHFFFALKSASSRFRKLRTAYPTLDAYLVLALPGAQAELNSSVRQLLEQAAKLVAADQAKVSALQLLARLQEEELRHPMGTEARRLNDLLEACRPQLKYESATQVELRFRQLNYELVWQLQRDPLVDIALTPQTKASIRIVLGTLSHFAGQSAGLPP